MIFEEIKRLSKNTFTFSLGTIIPLGLGIVLIPIYTRYLSPADYGILTLVTTIGAILTLFFTLNLHGAATRFYVDYKGEERRRYLGTIAIFIFIHTLFLALILTLFGRQIFSFIFKSEEIKFNPYLLLKIWALFFIAADTVPLALYRIREEALKYSLLQILYFLMSVGFIIYFVVFLKQGVLGAIKGTLFSSVIMFVVYLVILIKSIKISFSFSKLKKSLKFSLPIIPHSISGFVMRFFDRFIIERYLTLADVGLYALGYKIGFIMKIGIDSFNTAWIPFFYKTSASENKEQASLKFKKLITLWMIVFVFLALNLSLFSKEIIQLLTTPMYYQSYKVAPFIVLSFLFRGFYCFSINGLFFIKMTKLVPIVTGVSAIINIVANFILVPQLGMIGAAISSTIAFFTSFLVAYIFCQKHCPIEYEYGKLGKILGLGVAIFLLFYAQSIFLKMGGVILYIAGLFLLEIVTPEQVKKLLSRT